MKTGIVCINESQIEALKDSKADFAELILSKIADMSKSEIMTLKTALSYSGIPAECANCFFPGGMKLCGKSYNKNTVTEYCKKALFKGAELGLSVYVIGCGGARNIDEGEDPEECKKQFAEVLGIAGDVAKDTNSIIVIEPLEKRATNFINSVSEGANICRSISHSNVFLLADTFHMLQENEPLDTIAENANIIKHIHIASPETRCYPTAGDGFDYSKLYGILSKIGYTGKISIEAVCDDPFDPYAINSIAFLKEIFK